MGHICARRLFQTERLLQSIRTFEGEVRMKSFFALIDEKFFNPFCCCNREVYIACIDQLIEKSKEIPVLYETDARNTLILYLKNCEYTIETENIGEEVGSGKSPQENASAILRYFCWMNRFPIWTRSSVLP